MEKAYDPKELALKMKAQGLPILEEALEDAGKKMYVAFKEWITESAALSETKFDDFATSFLVKLDSTVVPAIEKIDLDGDGK